MEDWKADYKRKTVQAEVAAMSVKSGDRVAFTTGREAYAAGLAIAARKNELKGVQVFVPTPGFDFGWYDEGWDDSFDIVTSFPLGVNKQMLEEGRGDLIFGSLVPFDNEIFKLGVDVLLTEVSPPDEKGFCSFGASAWNKKRQVEDAKVVIAEVNTNLIRPYGDVYVHVSEIDYFVEHISAGEVPGTFSLLGKKTQLEVDDSIKQITKNVSGLIKDRDTIQIGVGRVNEHLIRLGMLDGRQDLGYHSEATMPGIINLVREGVINGKYKTVKPGKAVVTSVGGDTRDNVQWVHMNPLFEVVDVDYLEDIRVIAAHDNMVTINQTLMVDLHGQSTAESLGDRIVAGAGGQVPFQIGALLSKGGRAITILNSTAKNGTISNITACMPAGTTITIHKNLSDYVVTEYGVVKLRGKSRKQKAKELINIAHPKFREELKEAAVRIFGQMG